MPLQHLDAKHRDDRTPLLYAVRSGRHETVAILLEAGADPTLREEILSAVTEF